MKRDGRLSAVLHALLHMAEQDRPMTSAELAVCMDTNPVVVRRTMAGLREAGFVTSERGHGGGWEIARGLETISLKDIYDALGAAPVLSLGVHVEHPACMVEQAVNRALKSSFREAEALLFERFAEVTLQQLVDDYRKHAHRARPAVHQKGK